MERPPGRSGAVPGHRRVADRPADAFDPGAKYHIPGNTPYLRYFLASVLSSSSMQRLRGGRA